MRGSHRADTQQEHPKLGVREMLATAEFAEESCLMYRWIYAVDLFKVDLDESLLKVGFGVDIGRVRGVCKFLLPLWIH